MPAVELESSFDALLRHDLDARFPAVPIGEDDPAAILYTSGTTGRPRGVVSTHRNVVALCAVQVWHGLRAVMMGAAKDRGTGPLAPGNCALVNTPLFHVSGLYAGVVTLLATGVRTVWTTGRFDPVEVMQLIERERVTAWGPMGTMVHRVVNHADVGQYDLSSLRNVGSGGAPISVELQQRMREVFPCTREHLAVGYGLTEGTGPATINFGEELMLYPESVGRPLPTVDVEIRDADGNAVAEGREGEVHLRGPLVMKEYWRDPQATAGALLDGRWLRTGDIGRVERGLLYVDSRKRDLILRAGENIYPKQIEQCLEVHPDVREAAVVGVDHAELGQEVKAIVVPCAGSRLDAGDLTSWVAKRLAYFKVPVHWELRTAALPRNASGKVMKRVLLGLAESPFVEE